MIQLCRSTKKLTATQLVKVSALIQNLFIYFLIKAGIFKTLANNISGKMMLNINEFPSIVGSNIELRKCLEDILYILLGNFCFHNKSHTTTNHKLFWHSVAHPYGIHCLSVACIIHCTWLSLDKTWITTSWKIQINNKSSEQQSFCKMQNFLTSEHNVNTMFA